MIPILAVLLLGATPDPGPLSAAPPRADRGEVHTGPPLTHRFDVTHGGAGTVTITAVETGCGCLKPTVSRSALRPGDHAEVTLAVNTLAQPPGPNRWRAVVRYQVTSGDGPAAAYELPLEITATLVPDVTVTPPVVAFSTATTATQTVTVTDRRASPLTVIAATTTHQHLTATVRPPVVAAAGFRTQAVELGVGRDFPPGQTDETLVLTTTDPACPELRVPVKVTKRTAAAVAAIPEAVDIRFVGGRPEASAVFQVRRPAGGVVRIARVECDHPAVRAKWPGDAGPVATVRVVADAAKAAGGPARAEVKVVLAEPAGQVVAVPVSWAGPE